MSPNFIHICVDDMRNSDVAVMANVIEHMRDKGVTFQNHFTAFPLCAPSRVGMLTGLQPHNHGIVKNKKDGGYNGYQHLEANALPVWLSAAGYHVGHVGKFINTYDKIAPDHVPPGYADWRAMSSDFSLYQNFTLNENGVQVAYTNGEYSTDVFLQKVLDFIATAPQPFALFFWPNCCHWPAVPAEQDQGSFDGVDMPIQPNFNEADVSDKPRHISKLPLISPHRIAHIQDKWRVRSECLQSLDRAVATLVTALEDGGLIANTHVMFTSDNGFIQGEHRIDNAKDYLYEEGANVPLFWRQPNGLSGPVSKIVSNIDMTATMVELAGAAPGRVLDGKSLTPLLADPNTPWNSATLLQSGKTVGIASRDYRYFVWNNSGAVELYDMTIDRYQLDNKAGKPEYAQVEQACGAALQALLGCAGDNCGWTGEFPPPPSA